MPWKRITNLPGCSPVTPVGFTELFILKNFDNTHWLIGQYKDLTKFATGLRHDRALRDFLALHRIRIGLRDADIPPAGIERQECYGFSVRGRSRSQDFTSKRLSPIARPVYELKIPSINRVTDREENIKHFWDSQTPQSHHIVEFNNLEALGVSRKNGNEGMDYHQLPAVLLAAEFHQRYISVILKTTHNWEPEKLKEHIAPCYSNLYLGRSKLFEPMWHVSKAIFGRAGLKF